MLKILFLIIFSIANIQLFIDERKNKTGKYELYPNKNYAYFYSSLSYYNINMLLYILLKEMMII